MMQVGYLEMAYCLVKRIDRFEEDCYNDCFKSDVIFLNEGINYNG